MKIKSQLRSQIRGLSNAMIAILACATLVAFVPRTHGQGGVLMWSKSHPVPGVQALAVDGAGNAIVAGFVYGAGPSFFTDFVTVKYSPTGQPLWARNYNAPAGRSDTPAAIGVDSAGNVFVAGISDGGASKDDYLLIKYSSGGALQWASRYDGPAGSFDAPVALVVDGNGDVIVTGTSDGGGGVRNCVTVKYSNSGAQQWVRRYLDMNSDNSWAASICAGENNTVYVTGYNTVGEFSTIAYSASGTPLWTNLFGPGYFNSTATGITADQNGHVFVTGFAAKRFEMPQDLDFVTLAYSAEGMPLWTNRYEGPGLNSDTTDRAIGIATKNSKVFVAGGSAGMNGGMFEYAAVAYAATGATLWTNRYSGPSFSHHEPKAMTADSSGNVFVTGVNNFAENPACVTVAYSGWGAPLWTNFIPVDVMSPVAMTADNNGDLFIAGYSSGGLALVKISSSVPRLGFQLVNGQLVIAWQNGNCKLQSAPAINGPYADVQGAASPYVAPAGGPPLFFRLNCN